LSENIAYEIADDKFAKQSFKFAEVKVEYLKSQAERSVVCSAKCWLLSKVEALAFVAAKRKSPGFHKKK
jgi:hypothetical protein